MIRKISETLAAVLAGALAAVSLFKLAQAISEVCAAAGLPLH